MHRPFHQHGKFIAPLWKFLLPFSHLFLPSNYNASRISHKKKTLQVSCFNFIIYYNLSTNANDHNSREGVIKMIMVSSTTVSGRNGALFLKLHITEWRNRAKKEKNGKHFQLKRPRTGPDSCWRIYSMQHECDSFSPSGVIIPAWRVVFMARQKDPQQFYTISRFYVQFSRDDHFLAAAVLVGLIFVCTNEAIQDV